jgi:fibronectin type 3 domain-containing protein
MTSHPDRPGPTRRSLLRAGTLGAATLFTAPLWRATGASAAPVAATVNIDTSTSIPLQKGLIGYNLHITNRAYSFTDTAYRSLAAQLQPRWGRWSAGTANNVFDWQTGQMPEERRAQMFDKRNQFYGYDWERRIVTGKNAGYLDLLAYYDALRDTCATLTMVINTFTATPADAADLVRFCADNTILVEFWELQNEPYLFTGGGSALPKFFNSATDYLDKIRPFSDAILSVDPNARTAIAYTPTGDNTWDRTIHGVTSPWWDAIVWHSYEAYDPIPGDGIGFDQSMSNGNWLTAEYRRRIDDNYLANSRLNPTPMLQNELDVRVAGPLYNTQYNAVFNAESVMRLSTAPTADTRMLTGSGGIPLWTIDAANDHTDQILDAAERGGTVDTDSLDHGLYLRTVGVSNVIVNEAINNSASRWDATVTGSATVDALDDAGTPSTVDALYATAYQGGLGGGGKNYALVTNKSNLAHQITLQLAGATVATAVTAVSSSATDPQAANTAANPTAITAQTTTYPDGTQITVPPYSVVRLEWDRSGGPAAPRTPRITSAQLADASSVTLKWWNVPHATSYTIRYGTTSGSYPNTQTAAVNSGTVAGLTGGATYYFVVTATGAGGTTPLSNEVAVTVTAPATPSNVTAVGRRTGVATVKWRSVAGASGYLVRYGTSPSSLTSSVQAGNRAGIDIGGLTSGQDCYFTVEAYNGAGSSAASAAVTAQPMLDLPYSPHTVRLSTPNTSTSASLAWDVALVRALLQTFEDGTASSWTVAKGSWSVIDHPDADRATKVYAATSTAGLNETSTGQTSWTDLAMEAQVEVSAYATSGTVSLLARYSDADNYYRFVYDHGAQAFKIIRAVGGAFTTLAQISGADALAQMPPFAPVDLTHMRMIFEAVGGSLAAYVNNNQILAATDGTHTTGKVALGSNHQVAYFDKVYVWVDNMTGSGDGSYTVYRSTSPQSGYTAVASGLTARQWTDTTITAGHRYYYRVAAVRRGVESLGSSNILTVVT